MSVGQEDFVILNNQLAIMHALTLLLAALQLGPNGTQIASKTIAELEDQRRQTSLLLHGTEIIREKK